ncbi:MAG: hypothetical protein J0H15_13950 [Xanthomonadales bacterium]|nr:hypothetical protein [Xanthomonadales bacterium]
MATYRPVPDVTAGAGDDVIVNVAPGASAVSWAAILVGAAAAAALSLLLVILGFGLGLSSVSPWSNIGSSAKGIGIATVIWLAFTQLAASAIGGYLAGRLRTRWAGLHGDETYFRDTAHGFMAWAVATLGTAILLGSVTTGILSGGMQAAGTAAGGALHAVAGATGAMADNKAPGANQAADPTGYFVDTLFRGSKTRAALNPPAGPDAMSNPSAGQDPFAAPAPSPGTGAMPGRMGVRGEAARIFAHDLREGTMPDADRQYLGQVVAAETGLSQAEAEQRVTETYTRANAAITQAADKAREAADAARKAAAYSSLWMFVALLIGAFFASLAATFGGRRRDLFD